MKKKKNNTVLFWMVLVVETLQLQLLLLLPTASYGGWINTHIHHHRRHSRTITSRSIRREEDDKTEKNLVLVEVSPSSSTNDDTDTTTDLRRQQQRPAELLLTSALLRISYDGRHFTGWSSANNNNNNNKDEDDNITQESSTTNTAAQQNNPKRKGRSGRSRYRRRVDRHLGGGHKTSSTKTGFVRSVQGQIEQCFMKLYGNLDRSRIVVEGCSRTDKGVHATSMIAQVYCLKEEEEVNIENEDTITISSDHHHNHHHQQQPSIPGKRTPHPWNATDTSHFMYLPFNSNLTKLAFTLNRMLPRDVRIVNIAPVPVPTTITSGENQQQQQLPFHPTLSCISKTYQYTLSAGTIHDPTTWRTTWHVSQNKLNTSAMEQACQCLQGCHDFQAFEGAPPSKDDKIKRLNKSRSDNTTTCCCISSITLQQAVQPPPFQGLTETFTINITGDRFLYKMCRFLVGAITAVGTNQTSVNQIKACLETGNRSGGNFQCAPAYGLELQNVDYGNNITIDWKRVHE